MSVNQLVSGRYRLAFGIFQAKVHCVDGQYRLISSLIAHVPDLATELREGVTVEKFSWVQWMHAACDLRSIVENGDGLIPKVVYS